MSSPAVSSPACTQGLSNSDFYLFLGFVLVIFVAFMTVGIIVVRERNVLRRRLNVASANWRVLSPKITPQKPKFEVNAMILDDLLINSVPLQTMEETDYVSEAKNHHRTKVSN